MWSECKRIWVQSLILAALTGCSLNQPAYPSYRNEAGNINSIEMAWPDGRGMGAFVDSTAPTPTASGASAPTLKYRVRVVFDTGFTTTVVEDGGATFQVGDRVAIESGHLVPRDPGETDPKRDLAHF